MLKEITKSIDKFFVVSNQPLFQNLSQKEKILIANRSQIVEHNKRDLIYNEGQKKDFLYVVITGRITLFHPEKHGKKEAAVEILRKGDYFGIISLLTGRPHSASARVLNDARLIRIDSKAFDEILEKVPRLAIHFSKTLSRRLKRDYTTGKEIFQSTILSIYSQEDDKHSSSYARALGASIVKESGKKVACISINKEVSKENPYGIKSKAVTIKKPEGINSVLGELTGVCHFIILDLSANLTKVEKAALRQSDVCHLVIDIDSASVKDAGLLLKKIGKPKEEVKIILKEGRRPFKQKHYITIEKLLPGVLYATLPYEAEKYNKAIRRIARETAKVLVGLALGSGGAIGLAQVGVLEVLEEEGIPIDIVVGTSIGALVASLWTSGFTAKEVKKICTTFDTKLRTLGLLDITLPKKGLISGRKVRDFLTTYLGKKTFYDLKKPLRIVTCDINKREEVVISSGSLVDAVMASISIPGIFNPVASKDGKLFVDGGIVNPLPISVLSKEGIKRVIAVNSIPSPDDAVNISPRGQSIFDIIINSLYAMEYKIAKYSSQEADIYIHLIPKEGMWFEFYKAKEFMEFGRKKAIKVLPELKRLIK